MIPTATTTTTAPPVLGLVELAQTLGISPWVLRHLEKSGALPAARRLAGRRVYTVADLTAVRDALRRAGRLTEVQP
jgi:DNA-binding transcriptional MerR regulator